MKTDVGECNVSTVRLPFDHGYGGTPLWYETMIFGGGDEVDQWQDRYATEQEASEGHARVVENLKAGRSPEDGRTP